MLSASYEYCRELTERTAHNFRYSFMTLPPEIRRSMNALYAFNRITDDLGDDDEFPVELRQARLEAWRTSMKFILNRGGDADLDHVPGTAEIGTFAEHPSHLAIADMVARHHIPHEYLFAVIDGVAMDLNPFRIDTFSDLERYCYRVAGAVGLCCIHVWGFRDQRAIPLAIDCGLALQLTNILRDIGEDSDGGRIYLPKEDLDRFGYSANDIKARTVDERFIELMRFQSERAKSYYARSEGLLQYLEPPGRPILRAMLDIYGGLLREIERRKFDIYSKRASVPKWKKIWFAVRAMVSR